MPTREETKKHDLANGNWNGEYAKQLEKDSTNKLRCKGCGSSTFNILENKAFTDYRNFFATVHACSKCGLIANAENVVGHTSNSYKNWDAKPINPIYIKSIVEAKTTTGDKE